MVHEQKTEPEMVPAIPDSSAGASTKIPEPVAAGGAISEENLRRYKPLYEAAHAGDWSKAETIFQMEPEATTAILNKEKETALHVATSVGRTDFIRGLVELLSPEDLEIKDSVGYTCLQNAAIYGRLDAVEILVNKNRRLTQITDKNGNTPLSNAAYYNSKEVVWFLTLNTTDEPPGCPFTGPAAGSLVLFLTCSGFYDIVLHLLGRYPHLATARAPNGYGILSALAHKPSDFPSGCKLNSWERCIYHFIGSAEADRTHLNSSTSDVEDPTVHTRASPTSRTFFHSRALQYVKRAGRRALECAGFRLSHIEDEMHRHKCTGQLVKIACQEISRNMIQPQILSHFKGPSILHTAVQNGTVEIISTCLQYFPYLIWTQDKSTNLLHEAVRLRKVEVFNIMLDESVATKKLANRLNGSHQTILHLVGDLAPYPQLSSVSCPALQMQRELQWFQAVEEFIHPLNRLVLDKKEQVASGLFTSKHEDLLSDAERWMKDTSNSCMIVATLIATVVFAAAFTVPGGNIDEKGIPVFLNEQVFMVFVIFDALALFSSTTSIVMFLSILTARYAEGDFLRALPTKLILGFASLFVAIATMMVAFGATLYMVISERFKWSFIPIVAVTFIPVAVFVQLQLPLFIYIVNSTYGRGVFRPTKIW